MAVVLPSDNNGFQLVGSGVTVPLDGAVPQNAVLNEQSASPGESSTNITKAVCNAAGKLQANLRIEMPTLPNIDLPNLPSLPTFNPSFKIKNSYTKTISLLKNQQCTIYLPSIFSREALRYASKKSREVSTTSSATIGENGDQNSVTVTQDDNEDPSASTQSFKMRLTEMGRRTSSVLCMTNPGVIAQDETTELQDPFDACSTTEDDISSDVQNSSPHANQNSNSSFEKIIQRGSITITVSRTANADELCRACVEQLEIIDPEYFGIYYLDRSGQRIWLVHGKPIADQLGFLKFRSWDFYFSVKHYPLSSLKPWVRLNQQTLEIMYLCTRQDIASGYLPASFVSHVMLGTLAKVVERRCIKRLKHKYKGCGEKVRLRYSPNETEKHKAQVDELFKRKREQRCMHHVDSIIQYMEMSSKLQLFGVQCHIAKDHHNIDINIGLSQSGIHVFHDSHEIAHYLWITIKRIFYRQNKFLFMLINTATAISFDCPSPRDAKRLMREACEKHAFYRVRPRSNILQHGSGSIYRVSPAQSTSTIFSTTSSNTSVYSSKPFQKKSIRKFVSNIFLNKTVEPDDLLAGRSQSELMLYRSKTYSIASSNSMRDTATPERIVRAGVHASSVSGGERGKSSGAIGCQPVDSAGGDLRSLQSTPGLISRRQWGSSSIRSCLGPTSVNVEADRQHERDSGIAPGAPAGDVWMAKSEETVSLHRDHNLFKDVDLY